MVRRDGAAVRSERMKAIAHAIHRQLAKPGVTSIPLSTTVAYFQIETGLTEEKILKYLRVLEKGKEAFIVNEDEDKIEKTVKEDSQSGSLD